MQNNEMELEGLLERIRPTNRLRIVTIAVALILTIAFWLGVPDLTSYPQRLKEIAVLLFVWLVSALLFDLLVKKQKNIARTGNFYLGYEIAELFLLTLIVYNCGGVEWFGAMFYLFIIIYANIVLSKTKGLVITSIASLLFASLVILEYLGVVPFREFFVLGGKPHQDLRYLSFTIPFVWFTFYFCAIAVNLFTDLLKNRAAALEKTKKELEETKSVLEVKVQARTKELKELAGGLEQQVEKRTKELQEKIDELERFQKLAVGRELKMVELKNKIKELETKQKGRSG